jgi:Fe-S oxidoreductase/nitrate reductase gamma subunit
MPDPGILRRKARVVCDDGGVGGARLPPVAAATRIVYWNVPGHNWMYAALAPVLALFAWGMWARVRRWFIGRAAPASTGAAPRPHLRDAIRLGLLQRLTLRDRGPGLIHLAIYSGFVTLFLGTVVVFIHQDLGIKIMRGWFYLIFQSLILDVMGLVCLGGVVAALYRRLVLRPDRLKPGGPRDLLLLGWLAAILVTGYLIEGMRILATRDPWGPWSPVGYAVARAALALGMHPASALAVHRFTWWFHMAIAFGFIAAIPYTKLFHLFAGPANIYWHTERPGGALPGTDLEAEHLGAPELAAFAWKSLMDLDACTECGRCQDACPAYAVGQPLSPKRVVLDLQARLQAQAPVLPALLLPPSPGAGDGGRSAARGPGGADHPMIGGTIREETLWSCTTCRACMEACPVLIEHIPLIVDMRRHLAMERGDMPEGMAAATMSVEERGHPWRGTTSSRTDWYEGLDVRVLGPGEEADVLFWVGCTGALDPRNQKVVRAFARLMRQAGLDFGVLGADEVCTGDPARRMGNEYQFTMQAEQNVATLGQRKFRRIVTACPHCFNTLKNEYRDFGGHYEVVHHSQLLAELLEQGRLPRSPAVDAALGTVTFHDPCYLGRHNGIYEAPRAVVAAAGRGQVEMARSRNKSFCCGAGGGRVFQDERGGARINHERGRQARQTGASCVATACPFCMIMMEDGAKAAAGGGAAQEVKDIAELLAEAVFGGGEA